MPALRRSRQGRDNKRAWGQVPMILIIRTRISGTSLIHFGRRVAVIDTTTAKVGESCMAWNDQEKNIVLQPAG